MVINGLTEDFTLEDVKAEISERAPPVVGVDKLKGSTRDEFLVILSGELKTDEQC